MIWLAVPGILLGVGIAKCGFGTECSVMAFESVFMKQETYRGKGVPLCTFRTFRSMLPLQGFMAAIVLFNLYILGAWVPGCRVQAASRMRRGSRDCIGATSWGDPCSPWAPYSWPAARCAPTPASDSGT